MRGCEFKNKLQNQSITNMRDTTIQDEKSVGILSSRCVESQKHRTAKGHL